MTELTHIGPDGRPRMVDVSKKAASTRQAVAMGRIRMDPETLSAALAGNTRKGNPLSVAEIAGIMGAKRTSDLIPLCHPLPLTGVQVEISAASDGRSLQVVASVNTIGPTGVEMEALTAVSVACLTLYDMLKAIDKTMTIESIELVEKTGGSSGDFKKTPA
jgi:cyclic pyranopterin monophosphate synthase